MKPQNFHWLLALALLTLASSCRTPPPVESRWTSAIQKFVEADAAQPPPRNAVLFIGSSSIRRWTSLAEDFPGETVINRGFGGSHIADSVQFADQIVLPYRPRAIVFYAGENDIAAGRSPEQVLRDFQSFVSKVHRRLPRTRIYFVSIKPSPIRWHLNDQYHIANGLIEQFCRSKSTLEFIDVHSAMLTAEGQLRPELYVSDDLHLSPAGYEIWTARIRPRLFQR